MSSPGSGLLRGPKTISEEPPIRHAGGAKMDGRTGNPGVRLPAHPVHSTLRANYGSGRRLFFASSMKGPGIIPITRVAKAQKATAPTRAGA